jgi:hypothetical protein
MRAPTTSCAGSVSDRQVGVVPVTVRVIVGGTRVVPKYEAGAADIRGG